MKSLSKFLTLLSLSVLIAACSDSSDTVPQPEAPESTGNMNPVNVIPGGITQQIGAAGVGCIEYYVYAIASGGSTVNYDREVRITIIKDAYTDPNTGIPSQPELLEQHVLTIPAGSSVSPNRRVLQDATEEYDQDFTYSVEEITDTMGNQLSGYTLWDRTYGISGNCYINTGGGGWSYDIKGCFSGKIACDLNGNGIIDG